MKQTYWSRWHLLLIGCWLLSPVAAHAQQFSLFSQNTLHFGWGANPYYTNKNAYMSGHVVNVAVPNWDVAILQEVMQANPMPALYPNPGNYFYLETNAQGQTTYKERYAFLVRTPVGGGCCVVTPSQAGNNITVYANPGLHFSRPPAGIVVSGNGVGQTWIMDYHAIFGGVAARRTEVSRVGAAIQALQATPMGVPGNLVARFVIGGDWNFPVTDAAFTNIGVTLGVPISVLPNALTSLKRNGGLSQSYDHFLWDPASVNCINANVVPPPNGQTQAWFRTNFSDHLGVRIDVQ
jgi:hypothetical protein